MHTKANWKTVTHKWNLYSHCPGLRLGETGTTVVTKSCRGLLRSLLPGYCRQSLISEGWRDVSPASQGPKHHPFLQGAASGYWDVSILARCWQSLSWYSVPSKFLTLGACLKFLLWLLSVGCDLRYVSQRKPFIPKLLLVMHGILSQQ